MAISPVVATKNNPMKYLIALAAALLPAAIPRLGSQGGLRTPYTAPSKLNPYTPEASSGQAVHQITLLPFALMGSHPPPVQFMKGALPELRQQAATEGKLYFIHVAAGWCMPCQWMEQHTFADEALSSYAQEHFLAFRADVDHPEGREIKTQYQVNILPSILVFSSRGQLLGRHEGALEPEALLEQLKRYARPAQAILASSETNILDSPQASLVLSRPALLPDEAAGPPRMQTTVPESYSGRQQAAYFTIQLGVFSSYGNAVRQCSILEKKLNARTEIAAGQGESQGQYKIFLGRFEEQAAAADYLHSLRKDNIDGFVKLVDF